ncbi:unnamed protein product [Paramecium sonneborni]|uniref:Uncharacterized protein n=1 Tax=Paramecium sonneborni TaxID=65129 RepID=A0A8S1NQ45_9CILI|nr:unnamed protein product [Paramecium sonneborni]
MAIGKELVIMKSNQKRKGFLCNRFIWILNSTFIEGRQLQTQNILQVMINLIKSYIQILSRR